MLFLGFFSKRPFGFLLCTAFPIIILTFAGFDNNFFSELTAQSRRVEELPASRTPYGITYDGNNFWYNDPRTKRIYQVSPRGRVRSYLLGNIRMYGLAFNRETGRLYMGSRRRLVLINPVTGNREDSVRLPMARVAGVAFGPGVWYILEKGTGDIHYYDPELGRVISSIRTGNRELRDIAFHRGNLWTADGKNGVIYRYNATDKTLTGSLRAPVDKLRGLCFRDGQLWIVNRPRHSLNRLPFSETAAYTLSGERRYRVDVTVRFTAPPLAKGHVIVLYPPRTPAQKFYDVNFNRSGPWKNRYYLASGTRVFSRVLSGGTGSVRMSFRYDFGVTRGAARYFIPRSYKPGREDLSESPAYFFTRLSDKKFNEAAPFREFASALESHFAQANAPSAGLIALLRRKRVPARWLMSKQAGNKNGKIVQKAEAYLRGFGWIPADAPAKKEFGGTRAQIRDHDEILLARQPDIRARGAGLVYHIPSGPVSGARDMRALPAQLEVSILARGR